MFQSQSNLNTHTLMTEYLYMWVGPGVSGEPYCLPTGNQKILEIRVGHQHAIIRTESRLLGIGSNDCGQLGSDDDNQQQEDQVYRNFMEISCVAIKAKIKQVSCGSRHTLILDQAGAVYSSGEGEKGQLGQGRRCMRSYGFKPITEFDGKKPIINTISAGYDHSLALSSCKVYGWGSNRDAQLGTCKEKDFYTPTELFVKASTICYAGNKYSMFALGEGGVVVAGCNDLGQLGLGHTNSTKMARKVESFGGRVKGFSGCREYSLITTIDDEFYIAGTGCFGSFRLFTKIKHFNKCSFVGFGDSFGVCVSQDNTVYSWASDVDKVPVQNLLLSQLQPKRLVVGSKIILCEPSNYSETTNKENQVKQRIKVTRAKLTEKKKNMKSQTMADWNASLKDRYFNEINAGHATQVHANVHRNFMKSAVDNFRQTDSQPQEVEGQFSVQSSLGQAAYQRDQSLIRKQFYSPFFPKQTPHHSRNVSSSDTPDSNRISGFEVRELEQNRATQGSNPRAQRYYGMGSIQTITEENRSIGLTQNMTSKTLSKQNGNIKSTKMKELDMSEPQISDIRNHEDLVLRLRHLERENKKKDEEIKRIKKQYVDLVDLVESDACLRNIVQQNGKLGLLKKKSEIGYIEQEEKDQMRLQMQKIKSLLSKTIREATYDG